MSIDTPDFNRRFHREAGLPVPEPDACEFSDSLTRRIRDEIDISGAISFARYMELALYTPGLGYYAAGSHKFGASGDFVTAPEISPWFSRCVARQAGQVLRELPGSDILEAGAGSGRMCADILLQLREIDALPHRYYILELSAELRARQRETIQMHAPELLPLVQWLDHLPSPGFRGVILANELLDAMPVHRFHVEGQTFMEDMVVWRENTFTWEARELNNARLQKALQHLDISFPDGYVSEINLAATAWIETIGGLLAEGLVLIIDYGFPRHEFYHPQRHAGTLMCHYRHRAHDDPFFWPGLQDITAHVEFTAVAEAAHASGMTVAGFTNQAQFLLGSGLLEMVEYMQTAAPAAQWQLAQEIKRLTLPGEMGELFKVLALTRGIDVPLQGFQFNDQRHRL